MKTAISIPDDVFERAEQLARRLSKSRSQLYGEAMAEYLARHAPDEVTEKMNQVMAQTGPVSDPFTSACAERVLRNSEW